MNGTSPAFQEPGTASGVLKLLRLRARILLNGFHRSKGYVKVGYIVIGAVLEFMNRFQVLKSG